MGLVQRDFSRHLCRKRENMIRINQLKLPVNHTEEDLWNKAAKTLKIPAGEIRSLKIIKQSIDARKKEEIHFTCCVEVEALREEAVVHKAKNVEQLFLICKTPSRNISIYDFFSVREFFFLPKQCSKCLSATVPQQ